MINREKGEKRRLFQEKYQVVLQIAAENSDVDHCIYFG